MAWSIFGIGFGRRDEPDTPVEVRETTVPRVARSRGMSRYAAAGSRAYHGDFHSSSGSADYELSMALEPVRNRLRALARNSGTMKRYLSLLESNVPGPEGFNLQVRVRMQNGKPDRSLNERTEQAWANFCAAPTVDGEMDIIELEKQMVTTWARDGEYIIEVVNDRSALDGFLLNPVEGDLLDHTLNTINPATKNEIRLGVEINDRGRPVAYHFLTRHPGDMTWVVPESNRRYRRVPAERVIHIFKRLRPGQTRGEPQPTSIVTTTKMMDGFREAEVTGRRIKASAMGFAVKGEGVSPHAGLDGMADRENTDNGVGEFEMDMEPGTLKALPEGYDFKQFDPGGSVSDFAQFDAQMKSDVSMGVSISPVSLGYETAKLSYSTHRGIVAEDRETYRDLQSFFIRMAMNKIFAIWLRKHVAFNEASEIPPSRVLAILAKFRFRGRGWEQIDPTKDTKAENEQLQARTTSLSRIAAKRGVSRDDLLDEIEDDERALKERSLTQSFGNGNTAGTTSGGDNDDDDGKTGSADD
tara:strand:+ start:3481 stop:5061 length:1581 start_codon:yes stop_codon:yes gene_type:complete